MDPIHVPGCIAMPGLPAPYLQIIARQRACDYQATITSYVHFS
ncbi:hypothetical protein [Pseudomonas sp. EA_65y_Pfl1_P120]